MSRSDAASRPVRGMWFEQLEPGVVVRHAIRRTLTESDNVGFTTMTMNPAWLHLDFDYAKNETEFGRPLVNSMLTVAVVIGISVHETTLGTTVANLGFKEIFRVELELPELSAGKSHSIRQGQRPAESRPDCALAP